MGRVKGREIYTGSQTFPAETMYGVIFGLNVDNRIRFGQFPAAFSIEQGVIGESTGFDRKACGQGGASAQCGR
jgi:hypothetical protein